jgi:hypothetical protein
VKDSQDCGVSIVRAFLLGSHYVQLSCCVRRMRDVNEQRWRFGANFPIGKGTRILRPKECVVVLHFRVTGTLSRTQTVDSLPSFVRSVLELREGAKCHRKMHSVPV